LESRSPTAIPTRNGDTWNKFGFLNDLPLFLDPEFQCALLCYSNLISVFHFVKVVVNWAHCRQLRTVLTGSIIFNTKYIYNFTW